MSNMVANYKIFYIKISENEGDNTKVTDKKFIMVLIIQVPSYNPNAIEVANFIYLFF